MHFLILQKQAIAEYRQITKTEISQDWRSQKKKRSIWNESYDQGESICNIFGNKI